jgi:5'-methylthioadenosine phosphorylase
LEKAKFSIIAGTGLEKLKKDVKCFSAKTPYGPVQSLFMEKIDKKKVIFLPRHGAEHSIPPHKINYRANVYALREMGVERILATNAVGGINHDIKPGQIVVPHDFVDFTKLRCATFYDEDPVTHVFRRLGCDVVGMTSFPEVVLARELEMCYASICYVSNKAAGMQERLTTLEVSKVSKQILPKIEEVLIETIRSLPLKREGNCPCANALRNARFS